MHSVFNFFNHKNIFRPIWSANFCRNILIFWYSDNMTNFSLRIYLGFIFLLESIHVFDFTSTGLILVVLWCAVCVVWYLSHVFINFIPSGSNESFGNNRFSFILCWIHFYIIILQKLVCVICQLIVCLKHSYF